MLLAILIINLLILLMLWGHGRASGNIQDQISEADSKLDDLKERVDELWPPENSSEYDY